MPKRVFSESEREMLRRFMELRNEYVSSSNGAIAKTVLEETGFFRQNDGGAVEQLYADAIKDLRARYSSENFMALVLEVLPDQNMFIESLLLHADREKLLSTLDRNLPEDELVDYVIRPFSLKNLQ